MKVALKAHPAGIMLCQVSESLNEGEAELLKKGVAKLLANGKTKILVTFTEKAAKSTYGTEYFEKELAPQRELARKLGGDIGVTLVKAVADMDAAVHAFVAHANQLPEVVGAPAPKPESELDRLKRENELLLKKLEELLAMVSVPSSDAELRAAVEHYRSLAEKCSATIGS